MDVEDFRQSILMSSTSLFISHLRSSQAPACGWRVLRAAPSGRRPWPRGIRSSAVVCPRTRTDFPFGPARIKRLNGRSLWPIATEELLEP